MAPHRFALVLPILSVLITSGLWLSARGQYQAFLCPPAVGCPPNAWTPWTDYTPPSIQAAGMLNMPVAIFAHPLYQLLQGTVRNWELVALLLGVAVLWSYIGWRIDTRCAAPHLKTTLRISCSIVGCAFALMIFNEAITMFHAGLLYRFIAVCWSILMFRHFILLLRTSPAAQREGLSIGRHVPHITCASLAISWVALLITAAVALPPVDLTGRPNPVLSHVFAACGAVLLLVTLYAVIVYLIDAWRKMATESNRPTYAVWVGFETCLVVAAIAAVIYVSVRG